MSAESTTSNAAGETAGSGRCVCQEVLDHVRKVFAVSPEVKQHLTNSRIEFLKAIRAVLDERIEQPFGEVAAGYEDRRRIVRKGASPRGEAVHESGARQAAPLRAPPDLARPGASYAHSPARITGSELPAAVMPSTSILPSQSSNPHESGWCLRRAPPAPPASGCRRLSGTCCRPGPARCGRRRSRRRACS